MKNQHSKHFHGKKNLRRATRVSRVYQGAWAQLKWLNQSGPTLALQKGMHWVTRYKDLLRVHSLALGVFTEVMELMMLLFTLFWAIEANAEGGITAQADQVSQTTQAVHFQKEEGERSPASFVLGSASGYQGSSKITAKSLFSPAWNSPTDSSLPSSSLSRASLQVSELFDEYVENQLKYQNLKTALSANAISPTLKQDPLYVPPTMTLLRF
jgi:hypothetical protein